MQGLWAEENSLKNFKNLTVQKLLARSVCVYTVGETFFWSPADFVHLPTDKEMISL